MQEINGAIFDEVPKDITVWPTSVDVVKSVEAYQEKDPDTGEESTKYRVNIERYAHDEYIDVLQKKNATLEDELTSAQMALADVYEMVIGE